MDIYLIRHGQSTGNGRNCFLGWSDHPLTGLGRAQAEAVARRLAPIGPLPVVCSDLKRATETAGIIAAQWGMEVEPDARWREMHCGDLDDHPWDDFMQVPGLSAAFEDDPVGSSMPGGESLRQLIERVTAAFVELNARPEPAIVVVSHDTPIRAVLAQCLRIPHENFWTLATDNCGLTQITFRDDWLTVRTVNDISHLGELVKDEKPLVANWEAELSNP